MEAGRYTTYPAYQASYALWSGDVPDHWTPIRLKHVFCEKKKTLNPDLPAGSISFGNVIYKNEDGLAKETKAAYQELLAGEFLVNPLNMNFDLLSLRTALSSINVVVSTGYLVLQSNGGYNKDYLRWLLQQFDVAHMKTLGAGVRQTISFKDIGNSFIFEPPLTEQTQIASFLDRETAKIDALIAKQERLIELLEEKRQAVISHAVTKGLNPDAPLRPSGIDWLGEVPAHWEVKKLKHLAIFIDGDRSSAYPSDNDVLEQGIPFVSSKNIVNFKLTQNNLNYISENKFASLGRGKLQDQDLVITVRGTIGHVAKFDAEVIGFRTGFINAQMTIIRPKLLPTDYLLFLSESALWKAQLDIAAYGSTVRQLSNSILGNLDIVLPPDGELNSVLKYLQATDGRFTRLASRAHAAATLLKERRTALISAAVTGKIDVRDWQPPKDNSDQATDQKEFA